MSYGDKPRTWTDERIKKLKRFAHEARSYTEIADYFGVTRNAVAGAFTRYVPMSDRPQPEAKRATAPLTHRTKTTFIFGKKKRGKLPADSVRAYKPIPWPPTFGLCQSIVGKASRFSVCCGMPVRGGTSWCEDHCAVFFVPHKTPKVSYYGGKK